IYTKLTQNDVDLYDCFLRSSTQFNNLQINSLLIDVMDGQLFNKPICLDDIMPIKGILILSLSGNHKVSPRYYQRQKIITSFIIQFKMEGTITILTVASFCHIIDCSLGYRYTF